jgi:hypothetical protein
MAVYVIDVENAATDLTNQKLENSETCCYYQLDAHLLCNICNTYITE